MNDARWQRLKELTWFREAQDEVTAYVEKLRADRRTLLTLSTLVQGIPEVEQLLEHLAKEGGHIQHVDFGPAAATVEARASVLLRTLTGAIPSKPLDISDL